MTTKRRILFIFLTIGILFTIVLIILVLNQKNNPNNLLTEYVEINITSGFTDCKEVALSSIINEYKVIKLETTPDCIIGEIEKIVFTNNEMLIKDDQTSQLLLFDRNGKFLRKIGNRGKGPGEYIGIWDFCFDPKGQYIYVANTGARKVIKYDLSGNVIAEESVRFFRRFGFMNDSLIAGYFGLDYLPQNDFKMFVEMDSNLIERSTFFDNYKSSYQPGDRSLRFNLYNYNDTLSYWEWASHDTIFGLLNPDKIIKRFVLTHDQERPTEIESKNNTKLSERFEEITTINWFYETENKFFIEASDGKRLLEIIVDKETKHSYFLCYHESWEFQFYDHNGGLKNDIDGGLDFWVDGLVSSNSLYSVNHVINYKEYIKTQLEKVPITEMAKVIPEKREELITLLENSKRTDNPIITIITLK